MSEFLGKLRRLLPPRPAQVAPQRVGQSPFAERVRRRLTRLERSSERQAATLRALKAAQDATERRSTALTSFLAALGGSLVEAESLPPSVRERLDGTVRESRDAVGIVELLFELGHPLTADDFAVAHDCLALLPPQMQVRLARDLRERGYLERALAHVEVRADLGGDRDRQLLHTWAAERAVMSGRFAPVLVPEPSEPVAGRVLHVVGFSLPIRQTGYTIRTHYTGMAQVGARLEPHVVTQLGNAEDGLATDMTIDGVRYHHVQGVRQGLTMSEWLQHNAEEVAAVARRVRPAVLHAHSDFLNAFTATAVGRALGIPVVYEARGFWEESWLSRTANAHGWDEAEVVARFGWPDTYAWRASREEEARSAVDHVVTLSQPMARRIVEAGLPAERLSLAPNAVRASDFDWLPRDERLVEELRVGSDDLVIGLVSSLVEYEGIDTLLRAFEVAQDESSKRLHLLLVGDGAERERLEELAGRLGTVGVTFTGRVPHDEVQRYYSLIDVFVVPRTQHRVCQLVSPLKPFEAFASGCTLVFSDVEALRDIATESAAALTFESGDPQELAKVLLQLAADDGLRLDLARRGHDWVRSERTWESNAASYAEVYRMIGAQL